MPKECKLIAERPTIRSFQVSGEIPPFGTELVVSEMIPRKSHVITRDSYGPSLIIDILARSRSDEEGYGKTEYDYLHTSILIESMIFPREA